MVEDILQTRVMVKKAMKNYKGDKVMSANPNLRSKSGLLASPEMSGLAS